MTDSVQEAQQTFFTQALQGVIKQNGQSINEQGDCVYRAKNGMQCAVGHILTDEEYMPCMDNGDPSAVDDLEAGGILPIRLHDHVPFLRVLQLAHDNMINVPDYVVKMEKLAEDYSLKMEIT